MKMYLNTAIALLVTVFFISCKKDNGTSAPKDYAASLKDKTWSGQLKYTNKPVEYYSVHFNADNTLIWSQFSGDYTGHWTTDGKQLTMTFDASSANIKANITDDDKLTNIIASSNLYIINSGELIANPNMVLDNTVWIGVFLSNTGPSSPIKLIFKPNLKVETIRGQYNIFNVYTYTRSQSGAVLRFDVFFFTITSIGELKGNTSDGLQLQLVKQ
jgi:hypothetical protein